MLENDLKTVEANGYIYAKLWNVDGYDMYRTYGPKWRYLYQARRVTTNTNAAGGTMTIDITLSAGMVGKIVAMNVSQATAGVHTMNVTVFDEDNALVDRLGAAASAASGECNLPSIGTSAGTTANIANSQDYCFASGMKLSAGTGGASGQANDTVTVYIALLLPITAASDGSDVSWSKDRCTNAADCTIAANTISTVMQAVLVP